MGDGTGIQWTDATWNPIRGCSRVSAGCEQVARRFAGPEQPYEGLVRIGKDGEPRAQWNGTIKLVPEHIADPLRWRRPRRVFVNSMSDLFHEGVPLEYIAAVFGVMAAARQHVFQVLTKRPERAAEFFAWIDGCADRMHGLRSERLMLCRDRAQRVLLTHRLTGDVHADGQDWPLSNVWLGVSVEDQASADARIPALLSLPAAVRWVSYEPALGPVDWRRALPCAGAVHDEHARTAFDPGIYDCVRCGRMNDDHCGPTMNAPGVDWLVIGGESGPGARPFDLAWARSTIAQCREAGVAVFVKQLGANVVSTERFDDETGSWAWRMGLRDRAGGDPSEWPDELVVRQFPQVPA